jgi:hypothetical protein
LTSEIVYFDSGGKHNMRAHENLFLLGEIIAVAGTGWKGYPKGGGVDSAVIIQAVKSKEFFSYDSLPKNKLHGRKIKEILCKPR